MLDERYVSEIVASVVKSMADKPSHLKGVFPTMTEALAAVDKAYKQYRSYSVAQREKMISKIRELTLAEAENMAKLGVEETTPRLSPETTDLRLSKWRPTALSEALRPQPTPARPLYATPSA